MALSDQFFPVLQQPKFEANFDSALRQHDCGQLVRSETSVLQINVGKLCNQACHHCHVDAGPRRREIMPREVADRVLELIAASPTIQTVDITGGAPELNANFERLVTASRGFGRHVIDRCNLTIFYELGMERIAEFLAAHQVEIVASLPCYTEENVDKQRGHGVFEKSIAALQMLNSLGYGIEESPLRLSLVYNPLGSSLPPPQDQLEADYRQQLLVRHGIQFHRLLTITNMPIHRFAESLRRDGRYAQYMGLLVNHFNPATVNGLMCRSLVSVGWDGWLYDCDFNQMLGIGLRTDERGPHRTIWDVASLSGMDGQRIATGSHCFGCTAGSGSSCGGTLQ